MFFSLFAGLIMAFAFQLLLTNLGVALGLTAVGWAIAPRDKKIEDAPTAEKSTAEKAAGKESTAEESSVALPVSHLLGFGVTLSLATVLFASAFLATEFSQIILPGRGLIFGMMLWASYLLILIWISSATVSNVVGSVFGVAAGGIRRLFSAMGQVISSDQSEDLSEADRFEILTSELSTMVASQQQLPQLLSQEREKLVREICDRANLAPNQAETLLESLQPSPPDHSNERATDSDAVSEPISAVVSQTAAVSPSKSMLAQAMPDWRQLLRSALNQIDLSDWDIEKLWQKFQSFTNETAPFSVVSLDVEDYLLETPRWSLQSEGLAEEFAERLYDPEAEPVQVETQLAALDRQDFVDWLQQREDLSDETIQKITDQLVNVHSEVLESVRQAAIASTENRWQHQLKAQLNKLPLESLSADNLSSWLQDFVDHTPLKPAQVEHLLNRLDGGALVGLFERHATLSSSQRSSLIQGFEKSRDFVLTQFEKQRAAAAENLEMIQAKLITYFRYTGLDKLTAESVEQKLRSLLEDAELLTSSGHLRADLLDSSPDFNKIAQPLAQTLERRKGITDQQLTELMSALRSAWKSYQKQTDDEPFYSTLAGYFRSVDWPETGLNEIKPKLLAEVKDVIDSFPTVPQQIDNSRLLASLSLQPAVHSELGDWLQQNRYELLGTPRRWAKRAVQISQDWSEQLLTRVTHYLQHQEMPDLSSADFLQELTQVTKAAARSIPQAASALPELGESFWRQALAYRDDLDVGEGEAIAGKLTSAWQTVSGSLSNWEGDMQSAAQTLMQFVSKDVVDNTQQQFFDILERAQARAQAQTEAVKRDLQQRTEQVRRQAAIAAWWLFISLFTAGIASAGAGWLAVRYPFV